MSIFIDEESAKAVESDGNVDSGRGIIRGRERQGRGNGAKDEYYHFSGAAPDVIPQVTYHVSAAGEPEATKQHVSAPGNQLDSSAKPGLNFKDDPGNERRMKFNVESLLSIRRAIFLPMNVEIESRGARSANLSNT